MAAGIFPPHTPARGVTIEDTGCYREGMGIPVPVLAQQQ